jgi:hypothetical protein
MLTNIFISQKNAVTFKRGDFWHAKLCSLNVLPQFCSSKRILGLPKKVFFTLLAIPISEQEIVVVPLDTYSIARMSSKIYAIFSHVSIVNVNLHFDMQCTIFHLIAPKEEVEKIEFCEQSASIFLAHVMS